LTNATVDGHTKSPSVKNILIVDDDSDNCLLAVQFLRSLKLDGHHTIECTIANTGVGAFMAVQKQQFDAILMDIQMPVMDGFEATAHIRTFEKHHQQKRTPIIAVTAHTMENYRELCLENNMDDYMSKPVKKQPFHEMVKKWLNRSCNILVTDDSDDYRLLLKLQLNKNQQFAPIFATNGQEAIDVCQKQRIDVVLLDMQMPVLTGYEAAPLIRELPGYSDIPIWGLTAHEDEQEIRRVLEAGCNRCFTKSGLSVIRGIVRELENHFSLTAQAPST
jgi:CheY-like chemotaxis protein